MPARLCWAPSSVGGPSPWLFGGVVDHDHGGADLLEGSGDDAGTIRQHRSCLSDRGFPRS